MVGFEDIAVAIANSFGICKIIDMSGIFGDFTKNSAVKYS